MLVPGLLPRMKQRHQFTSEGIDRFNLIRLELIARATRQTDILKARSSSTRLGQNVVERERNAAINFLSQAVAATTAILLLNLILEANRNISGHSN